MDIALGDVVRMRKPHACGGNEWTITRTGADVKLRCETCGRIVMLDRATFDKRYKTTVRHAAREDVDS